jgi:hypothetical protein
MRQLTVRRVRLGSNASLRGRAKQFRFAPNSRHIAVSQQTTFRAISGLKRNHKISLF